MSIVSPEAPTLRLWIYTNTLAPYSLPWVARGWQYVSTGGGQRPVWCQRGHRGEAKGPCPLSAQVTSSSTPPTTLGGQWCPFPPRDQQPLSLQTPVLELGLKKLSPGLGLLRALPASEQLCSFQP